MGEASDRDSVNAGLRDGADIRECDAARGFQLGTSAADFVTRAQKMMEAIDKKDGAFQCANRKIVQKNPVGNKGAFQKMRQCF